MDKPTFKIFLFGQPRIIAPCGADVTPRSAKAKGLIALLTTPAGRVWSRNALQEKLWSDRGPTQGRDSLKKELTTLRKIFGEEKESPLVLNGTTVQIREEKVRIDLFDPELRSEDVGLIPLVFMEGTEIRDPKFQQWLEEFRVKISESSPINKSALQIERSDSNTQMRYRVARRKAMTTTSVWWSTSCGLKQRLFWKQIRMTLRSSAH